MMLGQETGALLAQHSTLCSTLLPEGEQAYCRDALRKMEKKHFRTWKCYYLLSISASAFNLTVMFLWR